VSGRLLFELNSFTMNRFLFRTTLPHPSPLPLGEGGLLANEWADLTMSMGGRS
jgi:hypothetical protein